MTIIRYLIGSPPVFRLYQPLPPSKPLQLSSGTIEQAQLSLSVSQRMQTVEIGESETKQRNILTLRDGLGNTILHKLVDMNQLNNIKWILN